MWHCTGEYLVGCKGTFTLLGRTGTFERITGKNDVLMRSDIGAYVVDLASTAEEVQTVAIGLAVWPALTYKTPSGKYASSPEKAASPSWHSQPQ